MTRSKVLLTLAILVAGATAFSQSKESLQNMYKDYLELQEYEDVRIDSDGDVVFVTGELTYWIDVNESDPTFARVVLSNIWPIESEQERLEVMSACHKVTADNKVVKAYMVNDNVWVACEVFVEHPEDFRAHIPRCIEVIEDATQDFVASMTAE